MKKGPKSLAGTEFVSVISLGFLAWGNVGKLRRKMGWGL